MPNRTLENSADVEGFGIVFLEANACLKPVIGGLSGGVPDAVDHGKTGVLVDANIPDNIADTVVTLLSDPDKMEAMGRTGRQRVIDNFTWNHSAEKIQQYVKQLI